MAVSPASTAVSYCRICPALCGILVDLDDTGRPIAVRGDPDHPLSRGYTCPKGRALPAEVNAPDRLTSSQRRVGASWDPIASSDALDEISHRLLAIIEEHGPRAVGMYVGTRGYEILQLRAATAWLAGIGSPSFYSTYTIDQPAKDIARAMHGSWPAGLHDASSSDVIMFVGNNPLVSATSSYIAFPATNPRVALRDMKARGLKVIVIDPRRTETAEWADVHLQPVPGEDASVLAGIVRLMIDAGEIDRSFVDAWAIGLEDLRATVEPFDVDTVERRSGVPAALLREAARTFGRATRGCAVGGTGLNMAPHPVLNEYLLLCLNTLGGRYVRAGEAVPNPGVLTHGRVPKEGAKGPRQIWGRGPQPRVRGLSTLYDQMPASALADEILEPGDGQIRALIVSGGNPVVALPDQLRAAEALSSLDLLVCLDVRDTATTALADYVIACRLSLEKADTTLAHDLRFAEPFAQSTPPVVEPDADLLEEWEVFAGLADRMETPWALGGTVGMPVPVVVDETEHTARTSDDLWNLLSANARVPLDEVREHPHGVTPTIPEVIVQPADDTNADRLQLAEPSLMLELALVLTEADDPAYPLRLISRRMWEYYNSWGQDVPIVRRRWGANPAFMNAGDMTRHGLNDEDMVVIESARASVTAEARRADDVPPGVISMAHCWGPPEAGKNDADVRAGGTSTSRLVDATTGLSQIVGMARQSAIPVRIRRP